MKQKSGKSRPSVLEALGITIKTTGKSTKVVAADSRVQKINYAISVRKPAGMEIPKAIKSDVTDLHKACRQGNIHDVVFLIDSDADLICAPSINSEDGLGRGAVALHFAAIGNQTGIISYLLQRGALPDVSSDRGITPLHIACSRGFVDCANTLLRGGANALTLDRYGKSARSILDEPCGHPEMRKSRAAISHSLHKLHNVQSIAGNTFSEITDKILYKNRR
jgi:hypothetical protein